MSYVTPFSYFMILQLYGSLYTQKIKFLKFAVRFGQKGILRELNPRPPECIKGCCRPTDTTTNQGGFWRPLTKGVQLPWSYRTNSSQPHQHDCWCIKPTLVFFISSITLHQCPIDTAASILLERILGPRILVLELYHSFTRWISTSHDPPVISCSLANVTWPSDH